MDTRATISCKSCTYINSAALRFCELCETMLDNVDDQSTGTTEDAGRACPACTLVNDLGAIMCTVCDTILTNEEVKTLPTFIPIPIKKAHYDTAAGPEGVTGPVGVDGFEGSNQATDGCIELLASCLRKENSTKFRLCSPMAHMTQLNAMGAHWACGYRNIQMLCLSLAKVPAYKSLLFNGDGNVPDIWGLQAWIEKAWKAGFDEIGSSDFGGSLISKSDWIGATECAALLRFFGLRAHLVNFTDKEYLTKVMNGEVAAAIGNGFRKVKRVATYVCDLCGCRISSEFRYRCTHRPDFDLCEPCERQNPQPYPMNKVKVESRSAQPRSVSPDADGPVDIRDWVEGHRLQRGQPYTGGGHLSFVPASSNQTYTSSSGRPTKKPSRYEDVSDFIVSGDLGPDDYWDGDDDGGAEYDDASFFDQDQDHGQEQVVEVRLGETQKENHFENDKVIIDMTASPSLQAKGVERTALSPSLSPPSRREGAILQWNNPANKFKASSNVSGRTKRRRLAEGPVSDTAQDLVKWLDRYMDTFEGGLASPCHQEAGTADQAANLSPDRCPSSLVHPIYLQHEGHSRTIVGLQKGANKTSLLLFDPQVQGDLLRRNLQRGDNWQKWVKRQLSTFKQGAYEIVYVSGVMTSEEQARSKVLISKGKDDPLLTELERE